MKTLRSQSGVAMTVTVIVLVLLALLAAFTFQYTYNQSQLKSATSGKRILAYYRAKAGMVWAYWRISTNYTVGLSPAGSFLTDNYDPAAVNLDLDSNGSNDVNVDIGPVTNALTKQRTLTIIGYDT